MYDGEPLGVGPFSLCLLEKNLNGPFFMVVMTQLGGDVSEKRIEKKCTWNLWNERWECVF